MKTEDEKLFDKQIRDYLKFNKESVIILNWNRDFNNGDEVPTAKVIKDLYKKGQVLIDWCCSYNKEIRSEKVSIKYPCDNTHGCKGCKGTFAKIGSIIKHIKQTFTRKEVIALCTKAVIELRANSPTYEQMDEWINNNI
jgi:hypothetical protein